MKKEYLFAALIAAAAILLSNISIIVPNLIKNGSLVFLQRHAVNAEDVYTYVSTIEQVRQGRFLTENQYTSEPQTPALFRPSYILIGNAARILNISSMAAYQYFRVLFSIIFCFVLYKFVSLYFRSPGKRLLAFTVALTASGLGFIFDKWLPDSIDLWIPEAFTFLSFSEAPHFMLSFTLMLSGFYFFIQYLKTRKNILLLPMLILFLFLSFEHPFDIVVIAPVILVTAIWSKIPLFKSLAISGLSSIGILFQVFEMFKNPILYSWETQNILQSPSPEYFVTGFGLLLLLGLVGVTSYLESQKTEHKLIISWLVVTPLLIYAPINFQRRFLEGAEIPLSIVSVVGIYSLLNWNVLKKYSQNIITPGIFVALMTLLLSATSFYTIFTDFKTYATDPKDNPYYYIKAENLAGIAWLGKNTGFNDVVLSNRYFGNLIPGLIARKVYLGHSRQTENLDTKISLANEFLLEKDGSKAISFLKDNKITYVFLGVNDSMTTYGFKPEEKNYLKKVYEKDGVYIYRVKY